MGDSSFRKVHIGLFALLVGLFGCASGGGSSSGGGVLDVDALVAEARDVEQGERPRDTPNTDEAGDQLDGGNDATDPAEARMHYEMALTSAQAAITEDPRNPLAYRLAALASLFLEDFQRAGEYFGQAEELRPVYQFEDVALREGAYIEQYQLASPLLGEGAYEEAAVYLENADAVYDGRPEAKITLAQIYASLRQHDRAIQKIDETAEFLASDIMEDIDEETAANWRAQAEGFPLMKAQVLADAGRFEAAAVAYRELVAANPDDISHRQDLGAILMQMGETEEALEVYTDLMNRPGLDSDGLTRIGLGFYGADQFDQAAMALERAAEVSPMDRDAIEWWTRSLMADSLWSEVPAVAERWIELDPQGQQALAILAQAANVNGNTQLAAQTIQRVQELEFNVNNLQMSRGAGGVDVSGAVSNKTLPAGTQRTLVFTFYAPSGAELGTVIHTVALGAQEMSEVFQLQFDSEEPIGGYGYRVGN